METDQPSVLGNLKGNSTSASMFHLPEARRTRRQRGGDMEGGGLGSKLLLHDQLRRASRQNCASRASSRFPRDG
jgi:hypothetical protein